MTRRMQRSDQPRSGFTIVELVVSIGILGLLMAISLPAVQRIRESARKAQCASHLKQILLAQHNYHESYGAFCGRRTGYSWAGRLAPLLNADMVNRRTPIYICPSDEYANGAWREVGNSYQSNHGTGASANQGNGFQGYDAWRSARDITDGLSNTAAVAERLVVPRADLILMRSSQFFPRRMRYMPRVNGDMAAYVDACRTNNSPPPVAFMGEKFYTHVMPPNETSCTDGPSTFPERGPIAATASSMHQGGINLAFADGSVKFISDSIDVKVWWAIGTRAGNEVMQFEF